MKTPACWKHPGVTGKVRLPDAETIREVTGFPLLKPARREMVIYWRGSRAPVPLMKKH